MTPLESSKLAVDMLVEAGQEGGLPVIAGYCDPTTGEYVAKSWGTTEQQAEMAVAVLIRVLDDGAHPPRLPFVDRILSEIVAACEGKGTP